MLGKWLYSCVLFTTWSRSSMSFKWNGSRTATPSECRLYPSKGARQALTSIAFPSTAIHKATNNEWNGGAHQWNDTRRAGGWFNYRTNNRTDSKSRPSGRKQCQQRGEGRWRGRWRQHCACRYHSSVCLGHLCGYRVVLCVAHIHPEEKTVGNVICPVSSTVFVVVARYPQRSGERKVARFSLSQANISTVKWRRPFRLFRFFIPAQRERSSSSYYHLQASVNQLFLPFFMFQTSGLARQIPFKTDQAGHSSAAFLAAASKERRFPVTVDQSWSLSLVSPKPGLWYVKQKTG